MMGMEVLSKYVGILEDKMQTKILKNTYASVNGKAVDDPEMEQFFKFKCWV